MPPPDRQAPRRRLAALVGALALGACSADGPTLRAWEVTPAVRDQAGPAGIGAGGPLVQPVPRLDAPLPRPAFRPAARPLAVLAGQGPLPPAPADPSPPTAGFPAPTLPDAPAPAVDWCDDPLYEGVAWETATLGDLTYRYLPGTLAEADLPVLAATRQALYDGLVGLLRLERRPGITVVLSPSRRAARHHGVGVGRALTAEDRIEVLYLPGEDSYERRHPGHELAHVLAAHVDGRPHHLPFLDEGLAELLDGSGRDLHRAYAEKLVAGVESRAFVTRLEDTDRLGRNYGRAGSFVQLLVERYGMGRFLALWRLAAVTWSGPETITTLGDTVRDAATLEAALDRLLREVYGRGLEAIRAEWAAAVEPRLAQAPAALPQADLAELLGLVRAADRAMAAGDAAAFRATVDGFYCDGWNEDDRARLAREAVAEYGLVQTAVVAAYPAGVRNYPEAKVHAVRKTTTGAAETYAVVELSAEKFPVGWRITWSTDW